MAALEVIALNKTVPQLMAPQVGDTYYMPRDVAVLTTAANANGSAILSGNTISETVSGSQWLVASQFDVGTAPNQIPLNQYLGTMAYQDAAAVSVGTLVSSVNIGVGVTPSAWSGFGLKAVQVGAGASFAGSSTASQSILSANVFFNGTAWTYLASAAATQYDQNAGRHTWYSAASGTAGNAATFVETMRLDAAGNLGLGAVPSAWSSTWKAAQLQGGSVWTAAATDFGIAHNAHYTSALGWTYTNTAAAARYFMTGAKHTWSVVGSGSQNTAITWVDAMTLDASSRLMIGTTSVGIANNASTALTVANGTATVYQSVRASGGEELYLYAAAGSTGVYAYSNHSLDFGTNNTRRTRIDASGNLIQRVNTAAPTLDTNQTMSFELTSNTSLKIVVRGTDGTTRSASLTLA